MKKKIVLTIATLLLALFILGCGAAVKFTPIGNYRSPKAEDYHVAVFQVGDNIDLDYEIIGKIDVGDSGITAKCGYDKMMRLVLQKAREVGADAIRIIEVKDPDIISSCYRITALAIAFEKSKSSF